MLAATATLFGMDYGTLKIVAMVAFFAVFVLILLRLLFAPSTRYEQAAQLPLEDEPQGNRESRKR
jgi:hypothetical protein